MVGDVFHATPEQREVIQAWLGHSEVPYIGQIRAGYGAMVELLQRYDAKLHEGMIPAKDGLVMSAERVQDLANILCSCAMLIHDPKGFFRANSYAEVADWIRQQLDHGGFKVQSVGLMHAWLERSNFQTRS